MGLFDLFDEMKENSEKRRRADEYRKRARKYIEDGQSIYNKAYSDISSYSLETSHKIEQHYKYKQRLINEISNEVKPVISKFISFDIGRKVFDGPSVSVSVSASPTNNDLFAGLSAFFFPNIPVPDILDLFSGPTEEYWEARRQKDEAEMFYNKMKYERERLRNIKEKMRVIRYHIDDEKQLLDGLISKIKNITVQLKASMERTSFSQAEADYLKSINKIAQSLSKLLTDKFLDDNFSITNQYRIAFDKIKAINNLLPTEPTVSNGTEEIRKLLGLLNAPVMT